MLKIFALAVGVSFAGAAGLNPDTPPTVTHADAGAPSSPKARTHDGTVWSAGAECGSVGGEAVFHALVNSPTADEMTLLVLGSDKSLSMQTRRGQLWSGFSTLTSDAGTALSRVFAAAYEPASGELLVVYRKASAPASVAFRAYDASAGAEQMFSMSLASPPTWIGLCPRPGTNEIVLLAAAGSTLYGAVWNGTSWGNQVTLQTAMSATGRPYAAAGLSQSRKVMVAWAASTGSPQFRTWDGAAWSGTQTISSTGGSIGWLTLAASPSTAGDAAILATIDAQRDTRVCVWNGTSWGAWSTPETNAGSSYQPRVAAAFQGEGSRAVLAWHSSGSQAIRYRVWDGSAWSGTSTTAAFATEPTELTLARAPSGDGLHMTVRRWGTPVFTDFVMYSDGGAVSSGTAMVIGNTGQNVPGVDLPTAPSDAAGTTDVTVGNNATVTVAPGSYGELAVGNSSTIRMSAGKYVFTRADSDKNSTRFEFDTTAGDIDLIFTSGDFDMKNGATMVMTGEGNVRIHIRNGDFDAGNSAALARPELFVYNGGITIGSDAAFNGAMYASGSISVASGSVTLPTTVATGPGRLSGMAFLDGVAGPVVEFSAELAGSGWQEPFAISEATAPRGLKVSRWREIAPDE